MNAHVAAHGPSPSRSPVSIPEALAPLMSVNSATYGQFRLGSHFQPVFSLSHKRVVGHEALLRARDQDERPVPPQRVFDVAAAVGETLALDALSRALHLDNFAVAGDDRGWLFLNMHPQSFADAPHHRNFAELIERCGIAPHRLAIEVTEEHLVANGSLVEGVERLRGLGCLIAIDDFGAGHSNFDRIWRIEPDIVKLDRSMIMKSAEDRNVRSIVTGMVSLLHQSGALVLIEGIETEKEALIAMDNGADFVQGFFFGRPAPRLFRVDDADRDLDGLWSRYRTVARSEARDYQTEMAPYIAALEKTARLVRSGTDLEHACSAFIELPFALRCFILDARGYQARTNVAKPGRSHDPDPRFSPLDDARGASWFRRPYFRRAMAEPEVTQITRPYLSVTGAHNCVTIARTVLCDGRTQVVCGDLDWDALGEALKARSVLDAAGSE